MSRRRLAVFTVVLVMTHFFILFATHNPDLSGENVLIQQISYLRERLKYAEMLNKQKLTDVISFVKNVQNTSDDVDLSTNFRLLRNHFGFVNDLQLPSVFSYMPHLLKHPNATSPAFKLSKSRTGVDIVLGIPHVKRSVQSYLMTTLTNILDSMSPTEKETVLIVVMVAEFDIDYVNLVASQIERKFSEHVNSGLIDIISPPSTFYPDMDNLHLTLGDPIERVRWRTKQNLDYAFLMMYSQSRGTFYVQLEDDIQAKKGFIQTMTKFYLKVSVAEKDWIVLDFCQLGFIGKMFNCAELPLLIQFLIMFYNDKPVDWLLTYMVQTKVCNPDKDAKACKKARDAVWIHHKPSIFQHVGTHSSLKGKVQKLKDKQFGKIQLHIPHARNPRAIVKSDIKVYKKFTLLRAYHGETYFWGLLPQAGDKVSFEFTPPISIESYLFRSGNVEHPSDRFYNATVEVLEQNPNIKSRKRTNDGFYIVGDFDDVGLAENKISLGEIKILRLHVHSDSENWAILSEIKIDVLEGR